jgi:hypothetical protein
MSRILKYQDAERIWLSADVASACGTTAGAANAEHHHGGCGGW